MYIGHTMSPTLTLPLLLRVAGRKKEYGVITPVHYHIPSSPNDCLYLVECGCISVFDSVKNGGVNLSGMENTV